MRSKKGVFTCIQCVLTSPIQFFNKLGLNSQCSVCSQLCFADDMFLFAGGTRSSVQVIMDELNRFERFAGLQVNKQKSTVFLAGVNDDVKYDFIERHKFQFGQFSYEIPWGPIDFNKALP